MPRSFFCFLPLQSNQPWSHSSVGGLGEWLQCRGLVHRHNECDVSHVHKPVGVSKRGTITDERTGIGGGMTRREKEATSVSEAASNFGCDLSRSLLKTKLQEN